MKAEECKRNRKIICLPSAVDLTAFRQILTFSSVFQQPAFGFTTCLIFNMIPATVHSCSPPSKRPTWRTTDFQPSVTAYSIQPPHSRTSGRKSSSGIVTTHGHVATLNVLPILTTRNCILPLTAFKCPCNTYMNIYFPVQHDLRPGCVLDGGA